MPQLARLLQETKAPMVVAVGDVVSRETLVAGIPVDVRIVDMMTLRRSIDSTNYPSRRVFKVKNPAGVIAMEAWNVIKEALRAKDAVVWVDGEEDLLTLPCVLESPDGAIVLYGQPREGLVVVRSSREKKREVRALLDRMAREEVAG
ncbi:DUF359 domain-containing protein [Candidatus Bathyarchaeota archaeon]|nr:MAG: DUF359 domain-containing protein [Candidatus Bathyarchaeota archaeon]